MKTPTDSELNLAMCKWMGWKWLDHPETIERTKTFTLPRKWVIAPDGELVFPHNAPDYLSPDSPRRLLNEAEARLTEMQKLAVIRAIMRLQGKSPSYDVAFATARHHVIAILQVVKPDMFQ